MARYLYTACLYLLSPLLIVRLLLRARKAPDYAKRWRERFGFALPAGQLPESIWLHAVSVGETIAAQPLIKRLLKEQPLPLVITSTTPTGSAQVHKLFAAEIAAGRLINVYLPYDFPWAMERLLKQINPQLLIIMETELWPNMLCATCDAKVPSILANARLSDKSRVGYQRVAGLSRLMLSKLTFIAAQSQHDADNFKLLGATDRQLQITGSLKFDLSVEADAEADGKAIRQQWGHERPVWVAASTHAGEDEVILQAHQALLQNFPDAVLILVPRHPERFDQVGHLVDQQDLAMARHSQGQATAQTQVYLGDTMGDMMRLFAASDVAFMGGSLVPVGGHNMLEPAALGLPVISGPHLHNFVQISELLEQAGVLSQIHNAQELAAAVAKLLADEAAYQQCSTQARLVVRQHQGAIDRLWALVQQASH